MKKSLLIIFCFVWFTDLALGEMPNCYCFKGMIQMKEGVTNGYFQLMPYDYKEIMKAEMKRFAQDDRLFTQFVKDYELDSLEIFNEILWVTYPADSVYQSRKVPFFTGHSIKVANSQIRNISYISDFPCIAGIGLETKLSLSDKSWTAKPALKAETKSGQAEEFCFYEVLYYKPIDRETQELVKKLSEKLNTDGIDFELVAALKRKKVLVVSECSD